MIFLPIDETMCRLTFEKFRQISLGDAKVEPKYWKRLGSPPFIRCDSSSARSDDLSHFLGSENPNYETDS